MHFSCRHVLITYITLIILSIVEQFIFGKKTEWYHAFLDKSLVTPHVQSCPKPIQLGYFDVAIDLELLFPLKNSYVIADETMQTNFTIDYSTHNFWVIRYLNLCDFANIPYENINSIGFFFWVLRQVVTGKKKQNCWPSKGNK